MAKKLCIIALILVAAAGSVLLISAARQRIWQSDDASGGPPMVLIHGGTFVMGADDGIPHEGPAHSVTVSSFWIDINELTVKEFARFVKATGYRTDAQRFGWSGVFNREKGEWAAKDGADWKHPRGPGSESKEDEPVVQVSWTDAVAYAKWAGKRLPTEAEWEYAARGGLVGKNFAWGDDLRPGGKCVANWWQGSFPEKDTGEDGYSGIAPVGSFPANGYGLHDMSGNVWEWCADWYDAAYFQHSEKVNPAGPARGEERSMRGGSWMCAENFCTNYRVAGRSHATPDSGLDNLGFRCVKDVDAAEKAKP